LYYPKLISWITEVHAPKVGALRRAIGAPSKLKMARRSLRLEPKTLH